MVWPEDSDTIEDDWRHVHHVDLITSKLKIKPVKKKAPKKMKQGENEGEDENWLQPNGKQEKPKKPEREVRTPIQPISRAMSNYPQPVILNSALIRRTRWSELAANPISTYALDKTATTSEEPQRLEF
jgi:hypothetical protein